MQIQFCITFTNSLFNLADSISQVKDSPGSHKKLGSAGLALHYANIITQIDTLVSESFTLIPRSKIYCWLANSLTALLLKGSFNIVSSRVCVLLEGGGGNKKQKKKRGKTVKGRSTC